jgi:hypothetical protein
MRWRVGQKNKLTYRWARKGSRPRAIHDQRTTNSGPFGSSQEISPNVGLPGGPERIRTAHHTIMISRPNVATGRLSDSRA